MNTLEVKTNDLMSEVTNLLENNEKVEIIVTGNSMLPFYKHGKTIVRLEKQSIYKKYDVVLFRYNNQYILHRIIKIKNDQYIIKGDATFKKEVATIDLIYGKVIYFETNNKIIKNYKLKYRVWLFLTPIRRLLLKLIKH